MIAFHSNQYKSILYVHPTSQPKPGWPRRNAFLEMITVQARTIYRKVIAHLQLRPPAQLESKRRLKVRTQSYCVLSGRGSHLILCSVQTLSGTTLLSLPPQSPGLSSAGEVTQPPSQSTPPKRKRVASSTSGEIHMGVYHCLIPGQYHCSI